MIEGSPSRTALMVAAMRADHAQNAPDPKILDDNLAMRLGGFETPEKLAGFMELILAGFEQLSDRETAEVFTKRVAHSVCMRSRLVEGELEDGRQRGLKQFVVLGAGLDSTAYRLPNLIAGLDVYEVDHPASWSSFAAESLSGGSGAFPLPFPAEGNPKCMVVVPRVHEAVSSTWGVAAPRMLNGELAHGPAATSSWPSSEASPHPLRSAMHQVDVLAGLEVALSSSETLSMKSSSVMAFCLPWHMTCWWP